MKTEYCDEKGKGSVQKYESNINKQIPKRLALAVACGQGGGKSGGKEK